MTEIVNMYVSGVSIRNISNILEIEYEVVADIIEEVLNEQEAIA